MIIARTWSSLTMNAPAAEQQLGREPGAPTIVPVAYEDKDAAAAKAEGADRCLARADQKRGRKLAEAIDKILNNDERGLRPNVWQRSQTVPTDG